jgi:hypothetical protein
MLSNYSKQDGEDTKLVEAGLSSQTKERLRERFLEYESCMRQAKLSGVYICPTTDTAGTLSA